MTAIGHTFFFYRVYVFLVHTSNHHVLNETDWSHCLDKYKDSMLNYFFFHGLHKIKIYFWNFEIFDKDVNYFKANYLFSVSRNFDSDSNL